MLFRFTRLFVLLFALQVFAIVATVQAVLASESGDQIWAVHGDIINEDGARSGWLIVQNGKIKSIAASESDIPTGARIVKHDGYIFPGLLDTHNHVNWNSIPVWQDLTFNNRYQWQKDPGYLISCANVYYRDIRDKQLDAESIKYGEIRALVGGTTLIQSTYATPQPHTLIKNLDTTYKVEAFIPNIRTLKDEDRQRFINKLESGDLKRVFFHLGEGQKEDKVSAEEFEILTRDGLLKPGVVLIHGVALTEKDFQAMHDHGMYLSWAPRSNWNLYHQTADIRTALRCGVTVALAPDWTISGSDNLLEEMRFAEAMSVHQFENQITPKDLFKMTTSEAAKVAGVEDRMGKLTPGYDADFFLTPKLHADPYSSLLRTYPRHINLVFVDGHPIYGDATEMESLSPNCDKLTVDGEAKAVVTTGDTKESALNGEHYDEITSKLRRSLPKLAPLIERQD